jgi:hypothetical protein
MNQPAESACDVVGCNRLDAAPSGNGVVPACTTYASSKAKVSIADRRAEVSFGGAVRFTSEQVRRPPDIHNRSISAPGAGGPEESLFRTRAGDHAQLMHDVALSRSAGHRMTLNSHSVGRIEHRV